MLRRSSRPESGPVLARGIVVAVCAALASIHFARGVGRSATDPVAGVGVMVAVAGTFAATVWVAETGGRSRRVSLVTVVAVAAALGAVGFFGVSVGLLTLPCGALLVTRRWAGAALVFLSAAAFEAVRADGLRDALDMTTTVALGGIVLFGIAALARLAGEADRARVAVAGSAVAGERLRIAEALEAGVAEGLGEVRRLTGSALAGLASRPAADGGPQQATGSPAVPGRDSSDRAALNSLILTSRSLLTTIRATAATFRSLSLAPEAASARTLLVAAGIHPDLTIAHREPLGPAGSLLALVLREAATAVVRLGDVRQCAISTAEHDGRVELRLVADGPATAARGADELGDAGERVREAGGRFQTYLDVDGRFVVVASVAAPVAGPPGSSRPGRRTVAVLFAVLLSAFAVKALLWVPPRLLPVAVPAIAAVCALQAHYSVRDAVRGSRVALLALAVLAFVPLPWFGRDWVAVPGMLVGSLLIAFRPALAVPASAAALALSAAVTAGHRTSLSAGLDAAANALVTALIIYGLLRLARLVADLDAAATALERAAVVQERLRAARDLHDLLGHDLAAVVLKAELAARLAAVPTAESRSAAVGELRDIAAMTDRAHTDLRTVGGTPLADPTFPAELTSAQSVLASAGITVELDTDEPVPAELSAAATAVLREGVTNILRHSRAGYARIATSTAGGSLRLEVENDGVGGEGEVKAPGSGVGGLGIRVAELGGTLSAGAEDGWFVLRAELPLAGSASGAGPR